MLLEIENVFGGYGNGDILKGISCSADYSDVLCLLGPNGCGKTTLFRMILGSLPVSNGKIKIAGKILVTLQPKSTGKYDCIYSPISFPCICLYSS